MKLCGRISWAALAVGVTIMMLAHVPETEQLPSTITVVGLFDKEDIKQQMVFGYAVDRINQERVLGKGARLIPRTEKIPNGDSFYAHKRLCQNVGAGIVAVFGPQDGKTSSHVQSICDALEIPHIETRWDFRTRRDDYSINLYPHPSALSKAYLDLVRLFNWETFCILYEDNTGLVRLQEILKTPKKNEMKILYKRLPMGDDYRPTLNEIKMVEEYNILLDCHTDKVFQVLKQAQQIGMMTSDYNYILTTLDLHLIDLEDFKYSGTNITALRIIDLSRDEVRNLTEDWHAGQTRYSNRLYGRGELMMPHGKSNMTTETALMYDAVQLFVKALKRLDNSNDIMVTATDCERESSWGHGNSLINYLKVEELLEGLTGAISFDASGFRTDFWLDIMELQRPGLVKVGYWRPSTGANFTRSNGEIPINMMEGIQNKTLRVSMAFNDPYVMLAESPLKLTGNDRYEGFCIDLLTEVAAKLKFNFVLMPVEGNAYGSYNKTTGNWSGMIKELLEGRADLAMTDLTISHERQQAVDFTMPFMNLGISILYVKPKKAPPSLFSFLSPLSYEVWIYMITAYVGVSLLMYFLSRLSPYEWQNPHPCNPDPDELENQFTLRNCLWFAIGSLMQQGCDFLPQAVSTRLVAGMWWFFTLIMISSYTANLAAFLTIEQMETPIESVDDLAKQTKIKYGTKDSGTTKNFFQFSNFDIYQQMYRFMSNEKPSVFVSSNKAGVDRVERDNGLYAFFMESTSIEYMVERRCKLNQVGGLLDSKSYGLALPKNSPYKGAIDVALLTLQSEGRFHVLKNKWFRQKKGGGKCKEEAGGGGGASELNLSNVGGVFVVLMSGMGLALVVAMVEFSSECWSISKDDKIPLVEVLKDELTFVFKCKGSSKPVRKKVEPEEAPTEDVYGSNDYNYTVKKPLT
ncbi:glutamate receptor ionotropic, kainate 2-like isoform X1 [Macrobrachium rosenbergii]|uniref:glutamate receptor ionotropic, kainate 2-like isoform X1 n=2 Tax=Macrobrachium rosenbergii TaxID=79674 RepID=UPI0034D43896